MKTVIKQYFPWILTVLCAVFAIHIFFHGFANENHTIFDEIGKLFSNTNQKDNQSNIAQQIEAQPQAPLPSIKYDGNTLTVGELYEFESLFTLSFPDGTMESAALSNTALYLVEVKNSAGNSVLTKLSASAIENLEELPSAAIYNEEEQLLSFHTSGIYTLYLRMFYQYEDGVLYQCNIPVEVR